MKKSEKTVGKRKKLTAAGDYTYRIKEVKGSLEGVTYDKTVYEVTVHVEDDLKGQLSASLNEAFTGIKFVNTYEKPEDPKKPEKPETDSAHTPTPTPTPVVLPMTGDLNNPILWIAVAAAAGGFFVSRRKK